MSGKVMYAMRNKETGLYFHGGLMDSEAPRLYRVRPSIKWTTPKWSRERGYYYDPTKWEIVLFATVEVGTEEFPCQNLG